MSKMPRPQAPIAGNLLPTREWLDYLRSLAGSGDVSEINKAIVDLQKQVSDLENAQESTAEIQGIGAVRTLGLLADGLVRIDLRELEDAGGGSLKKIDRDQYGRVAGTSDPTTDDLPEGADNLYYTDVRADARAAIAVDAHEAEADPHPQYADDSTVVHKSGGETISGEKVFVDVVRVKASNAMFLAQTTGGVDMLFAANDVVSEGYIGTGSNHALGFYVGNTVCMRLHVDRTIDAGSDNLQNFGSASSRWKELFAGSSVINTSDAREKTSVRPLTHAELTAATELGNEIGVYQWLAMIEAKGAAARQHIGMTVQRAIEIMQVHGLDPFAYGFICYDKWVELPEILGDDGEVVQEHRPAGDRYSFRMDELLAFIARGLGHRLDAVEQRLTAAGI